MKLQLLFDTILHANSKYHIFPILLFGLLPILILWDLLLPGYLFALDDLVVAGPHIIPADIFQFLIHKIIYVVPSWIVQRIVLYAILVTAGVSAYWLVPKSAGLGRYYAGLLYVFNPFMFTRFLAGHEHILIGYMLFPIAIKCFLKFLKFPNRQNSLVVSIILAVISVSLHMLLTIVLVLGLIFIFTLRDKRRQIPIKGIITILISFFLMNVYWLIPLISGQTSSLDLINYTDLQVFMVKPLGSGINTIFSVMSMHGFWLPYNYISNILPGWQVFFAIILFLTIFGFMHYAKSSLSTVVWCIGIAGVLSIIITTAVSTLYFQSLFTYLFNNVTLFKAFREPQRLVSLLVLAYSFLGGLGVGIIAKKISKKIGRRGQILALAITILTLLTPVVYSSNMLFGFQNNITNTQYPSDWYLANEYMNSQEKKGAVLFLPWHLYMPFSWTRQNIANPAPSFFDLPVMYGKNIEVGQIYSQSSESTQKYIEFVLANSERIHNFGELVAPLNIKYIILAKEADYQNYQFLYQQSDLKLITNSSTILLFENIHEVSPIYEVNLVKQFKSLEGILNATELTNAAYIPLKLKDFVTNTSYFKPLEYSKSDLQYKINIGNKSSGIIILTEPYEDGWVVDGARRFSNLNTTTVFIIDNQKESISIYNPRTFFQLSYGLIALITSIVIIYLFIVDAKFSKKPRIIIR